MLADDSIQSMGGQARAESLSAEQRAEIARKAATARWSDKPAQATHRGNFKEHFGIDVDCYVLDDGSKTPVLSLRGLSKALGFPDDSGSRLKSFLSAKKIAPFAGQELNPKLSKPLVFQWAGGGKKMPPTVIHGFDASVLLDICNVIIEAQRSGVSGVRFERAAKAALIITGAAAKAGIRNLVYALAGYNPTAEQVITAFKLYVQEEAKKYEKEFPSELYQEWYRLYQIPPIQGRGRPWEFKSLTVNHIYTPLAKSNGKILELTRALKSSDGDRRKKLFQFLSVVGTRALRFQLGRVYQMASESKTQAEYEFKITKNFGGQLDLPM
ncbi:MAG TPA: P63C domain-containing protein [Verrucomicrobiae bacterium]|jgi:hypothetical protein